MSRNNYIDGINLSVKRRNRAKKILLSVLIIAVLFVGSFLIAYYNLSNKSIGKDEAVTKSVASMSKNELIEKIKGQDEEITRLKGEIERLKLSKQDGSTVSKSVYNPKSN